MGVGSFLYKYTGLKAGNELVHGHPMDALNDSGLGQIYDIGKGALSAPTIAVPTGAAAGAAPPDPSRLHINVATGQIVDLVTGQEYVNTPTGIVAKGTPNTQMQSGNALNRAAGFYNQLPGYDKREATAYGGEGATADYLNSIAHGTGPSVAGTQLAVGEDMAAKQQLAQAAGASGNNAALARMAAMGNTGLLQTQTNQQQSVARAGEMTNALNQLAGVQGNMVNQSQAESGQKISAADTLNTIAMNGETQHEGQVLDANKANADAQSKNKALIVNAIAGGANAMGRLG